MATIRKRGESWQAQVRRRGRTVSRSFIQKADAQRWASQTEIEADRRGLTNDRKKLDRLKVSDILTRFRDTECPKRPSGPNEAIIITAILNRDIARIPLSALTKNEFATYRDLRLKTVRPGTLIRELGLVQHIIEKARTDWGTGEV